jgi:uncharacterized membrane protein HdeD (DUF308 family)
MMGRPARPECPSRPTSSVEEDAMTIPDTDLDPAKGAPTKPAGWVRLLPGAVMIVAGVAVLADVGFASLVSSAFIGAAAIIVGTFEIVHAVWRRGWGGLPWQILLGLLYIALGLVLVGVAGPGVTVPTDVPMRSAGQGELLLTYGLGWVMLLSGAFGVVAGLVVLAEFPKTGLWVFGLLLGVDLIVHGAAWLGYAFPPKARTA